MLSDTVVNKNYKNNKLYTSSKVCDNFFCIPTSYSVFLSDFLLDLLFLKFFALFIAYVIFLIVFNSCFLIPKAKTSKYLYLGRYLTLFL